MIINYFDEIFSLDFIIIGRERWCDKNVSMQPRFFSPNYEYSILINEECGIQILDKTGCPLCISFPFSSGTEYSLSIDFPLSSKGLKNTKRYIELFCILGSKNLLK